MKRSEIIFNLISVPVDAIALAGAGLISYHIRLHSFIYRQPVLYELSRHDFIVVMAKVIPVLLVVFALVGLYNLKGNRRLVQEFNRILAGTSLGLLFALILFFFKQQVFPSRFIILAAGVLSVLLVFAGRIVIKLAQEFLFVRGYGLHRLVMINGKGIESNVIRDILNEKSYGYKVIAQLENSGRILEQIQELVERSGVDEIIQANPNVTDEQNLKLVEFARDRGIQFSFVPNLFEVQRNVIELTNLQGIPVISLKSTPLDGWGKVIKRLFDIIVSALCLLVLSPVFLAAALAIRLNSRGPIIYWQWRVGQSRNFKFFKFRSMFTHLSPGERFGGEEAERIRQELYKQNERGGTDAVFFKISRDPRVTSVGRYLRKTKLDELPQFWNVLRGDMSLIGPRPHLPEEVEKYRNSYPRMFSIKPGIFGISQLAQLMWPTLPFEEEVRLTVYYIENWTLWWDIKILFKTAYNLIFSPKPPDHY
jgi:exopolysaccharide biosynthesis polyprenyl glycosylphosphotransferase